MASDPLSQPGSSHDLDGQPVTPTPLPSVTPPSVPVDPLPINSTQTTDSGLTPNVAAGLAVLLTLISGLVFLFLEKRNQFVRFWAMQAVFFGAASIVFSIVSTVISSVLGHIFWLLGGLWVLFSMLVTLGLLVVWIIMLIKAFSGKEWEVPFLGKLAREQLSKLPPTTL